MWFEEALRGHEKYYDYFIWEDGVVDENGVTHPPNNWVSSKNGTVFNNLIKCGRYNLYDLLTCKQILFIISLMMHMNDLLSISYGG